jgi:hypothetical protein
VLGPKTLAPAARLDRLIRVFALLAHVAPDGDAAAAYCLAAQHYTLRLLTGALLAAASSPADGPAEASGAARPASACNTAKVGSNVETPGARSGGSGAARVPDAPEGWATWREDAHTAAVLASDTGPHSLATAHIARPEALDAALNLLVCRLCAAGHSQAALPVTHLRRLLAPRLAAAGRRLFGPHTACSGPEPPTTVPPARLAAGSGAEVAAIVQLAALLEDLELPSEAQRWLEAAAGRASDCAEADAGELRAADSVAELRRLVRHVLAARGSAEAGPSPGAGLQVESQQASMPPHASELVQQALAVAAPVAVAEWLPAAAQSGSTGLRAAPPRLRPWEPYQGWLAKAEYLAARGQSAAAAGLLSRAEEHALLAGDAAALSLASLLAARLSLLGGRPAEAAARAREAQARGCLGLERWCEAVKVFADAREGMPGSGERDALAALESGVRTLEAAAGLGARSATPAVSAAAAALRGRAVQLLLRRTAREDSLATAERVAGGSSSAGSEYARALAAGTAARVQALSMARRAAGDLERCGRAVAPRRVQALFLLAEALLAAERGGPADERPQDRRPALLEVLSVLKVRAVSLSTACALIQPWRRGEVTALVR